MTTTTATTQPTADTPPEPKPPTTPVTADTETVTLTRAELRALVREEADAAAAEAARRVRSEAGIKEPDRRSARLHQLFRDLAQAKENARRAGQPVPVFTQDDALDFLERLEEEGLTCPLQGKRMRRGQPLLFDAGGWPLTTIDSRTVSMNPDHDCHRDPRIKVRAA